jgi:hypothetical protein
MKKLSKHAPSLACLVITLVMTGCAHRQPPAVTSAVLKVPFLESPIVVDGNLDERCYRERPQVRSFAIAGEPSRRPAATSAWLFWSEERLVFTFDCDDSTPVNAPPSQNENDVDPQDRVELFLWSGREADRYFCIEIASAGAVHDYAARFYRQFDNAWSPRGMEYAVKQRHGGYCVEAALSRAAMEAMGFKLRAGMHIRAGLFRADFVTGKPESPDWITWVDAKTPQPDFHVAGAFGTLLLSSPR